MKNPKYVIDTAIVALVLSVLACSLGAPTSPTEAPTTAPSLATAGPTEIANARPTEAAAPSGDPLDIIGRAWRAEYSAAVSRRHTVTTDGATTSELTVEYVAPGYIHQIIGSNEFIYIKDRGAWRKAKDGTWAAWPVEGTDQVFAGRTPAAIDALIKTVDAGTVKFLGPQLLDGRPTWQYQFIVPVEASAGDLKVHAITYKMWIGVADGLPYREETVNDSVLHADGTTHGETVIEYPADIPVIQPGP